MGHLSAVNAQRTIQPESITKGWVIQPESITKGWVIQPESITKGW